MSPVVESIVRAVETHVPLNVVRARVAVDDHTLAFTGCAGPAIPMYTFQEVADFLKYTPGVWGVGVRQANGSNAVYAWFVGETEVTDS